MKWSTLLPLGLAAPANALIRFGCSQLVVDRLDPLVNPGAVPAQHLHQIIGGNSFSPNMSFPAHDLVKWSTCTTCTFSEDFSNYWTAVLYFKARNGTYHRVSQIPNVGFEGQNGGMTVYYMQNGLADFQQQSKVTAFKPGFRMLVGDASARTKEEADRYPQLTYTCLQDINTRFPESKNFPDEVCPFGIMSNLRFPTCWDGKTLDTENHMDHISYPASGTFDSQGPCPDSHPVRLPQLMYEVIWDTKPFNDRSMWPEDGSQPFVWSMEDYTGYGTHGDYVFGWKDDSLQKAMDTACYVNCPTLATQSIQACNQCALDRTVDEEIDGWLDELPGRGGDEVASMGSSKQ